MIVGILGVPLMVMAKLTLTSEDYCMAGDGLVCFGEYQLVANLGVFSSIFISLGVITGIVAVKTGINVGYTRKTLHFCSFFLPFAINKIFHINSNILLSMIKLWIVLFVFLCLTKTIRRYTYIPLIIFRSIDRPDDRPYTLAWLVSQFIATSGVVSGLIVLWNYLDYQVTDLVLILTLIGGLGDGLAEPVGIRWGKHKYRTRAIYYKKRVCSGKFTRSYEGSAVVFVVALSTIAIFYRIFSIGQLIITFATLPIVMTLAEAFSPRTWDTPFMYLIGGLLLTGILKIPL